MNSVEEIKRKYWCAVNTHTQFNNAYQEAVKSAGKYFEERNYEMAQEQLDFAKAMLGVSANAREEMDKYHKELTRRHATIE